MENNQKVTSIIKIENYINKCTKMLTSCTNMIIVANVQ